MALSYSYEHFWPPLPFSKIRHGKRQFSYTSKVWSKTILPEKVCQFQQKEICNKLAYNVFDNKYEQNKTATERLQLKVELGLGDKFNTGIID